MQRLAASKHMNDGKLKTRLHDSGNIARLLSVCVIWQSLCRKSHSTNDWYEVALESSERYTLNNENLL